MANEVFSSVQSLTSSNYMTGEPDYEAWANLVAGYGKVDTPETATGASPAGVDVEDLTDLLVQTLKMVAIPLRQAVELHNQILAAKANKFE
jgi:hypothetical protein